jgi:hypothetical protein
VTPSFQEAAQPRQAHPPVSGKMWRLVPYKTDLAKVADTGARWIQP